MEHVDVPAAEGQELAEAEAGERAEHDHEPVAGVDGVGQGKHLGHSCHRPLWRALDARTFDETGVVTG